MTELPQCSCYVLADVEAFCTSSDMKGLFFTRGHLQVHQITCVQRASEVGRSQ